eukprot:TRINITY_DN65659_c0_g1_i1.p2 TRINITY_DN65659_c0_g1~~TRINITY_DN65659_c0_g1_i1.p2  ORF type:complete len:342 (+),score=100.16 TRINITY_DN65659_c0_g1_i1:95-1120(+)
MAAAALARAAAAGPQKSSIEQYGLAFFPPDGQTRGCRDNCLGGTMLPTALSFCALLTVLCYGVRKTLLRSWEFRLTAGAKKALAKQYPGRDEDGLVEGAKDFAAIGCVGGPLWVVLGPCALYLAIFAFSVLPADDPLNFQNDPSIMSPQELADHNTATLIGELFLGYTIFMTVMWFAKWDHGVDTIIHHIAFITIGIFQVGYSSLVKVGLWAIAMETSTPPLYLYLIFRQVDGPEPGQPHPISDVGSVVFGVLFILLRMVCFGWAVIETTWMAVTNWTVVFPDKEGALPPWKGMVIVVLGFFGWMLQLYWGRLIVGKLRGLCKPKEHKAKEVPSPAPYGAV